MNGITLIGDPKVKSISVEESGEAFVDLSVEFPKLKIDLDRHYVQKESKSISFVRRSVANMLMSAQNSLPLGISFLIKEGYRPMVIQVGFFKDYSNKLRNDYPEWSEELVYKECCKLNAPPEVAPHTTGGAIDLTIVNKDGIELDMGTRLNASPQKTEDATFTNAGHVSDAAKANRQILIDVMTEAGFTNYPTEWWHWSYGDKYWGFMNDKSAIYGSVDGDPPSLT